MNEKLLRAVATGCYLLGMVCALLIFSYKTYGYAFEIRILFYVSGALGLLFNLLQFRTKKQDNNLLFWFGSLAVYIGFISRILKSEYANYLIILGLLLTAASYFYDPFKKSTNEEDELLDQ